MHDNWYIDEESDETVSIDGGQWIDLTDRLPKSGVYVPLLLSSEKYGQRYWVKAMFVHDDEIELSDDQDPFSGCITKEDGTVMCPSGWYECDENDDVIRPIDGKPVAWLDLRFPTRDGKSVGALNERVRAELSTKQINEHHALPWKVHEQEYELWNGMKQTERTISTAWIQGQLKSEVSIVGQAFGAKDKFTRLWLTRDDAEFIVKAVNSYYDMRRENRDLKRIVEMLLNGEPDAKKMAELRGLRPEKT